MAAMQYDARTLADDPRSLIYGMRGRVVREPVESPELYEEQQRPQQAQPPKASSEPEDFEDSTPVGLSSPYTKEEEGSDERCRSPVPQRHGKNSFCIDALLGTTGSDKSRNLGEPIAREPEFFSAARRPDLVACYGFGPGHVLSDDSSSRGDEARCAQVAQKTEMGHEEDIEADMGNIARTGSTSPGSNGSRSPSPPISPGSEDPSVVNGLAGGLGRVQRTQSPHLGPSYAAAATAVQMRQGQGFLLHPGGPIVHPSGLYYHPSVGASAFHSIHKEGQPVQGHPQSGGAHPQQQQQQHHIHPLQLEWLARTGMLYPRLSADLAGEDFFIF